MQINKGDKLRYSTDGLTYEVTNVGENYFDHKAESSFIFVPEIRVTKETPKPLYHDGRVVANKTTSFVFRIDGHYHDGNGYVYIADGLGFSTFYKEENLRPLTEQEKQ